MEEPSHPNIDEISLAPPDELDRDLSDVLRARVKGEFEPGERLLWAGRNRDERSVIGLGHLTTAIITAGCFVVAFLSLWLFHDQPSLAGIGAMALILGSCCVTGLIISIINSFLVRGVDRGTLYALTDRRLIIWRREFLSRGIAVHSGYRGQLKNVDRVEYPDRSGKLKFTLVNPDPEFPMRSSGIPDVRRVEQIVRNYLISDVRED